MESMTGKTALTTGANVRVANIEATRERLRKHGIEFLTDPWDRGAEIRAYVRDPDGHLIEIGETTGMARGMQGE